MKLTGKLSAMVAGVSVISAVVVGGVWEMGAMNSTTSSPATSPQPSAETSAGFEPDEVFAGLVATALPFLAERGLDHPSLGELFASCGVSRARAAEAAATVLEELRLTRLLSLAQDVRSFLLDHPGSVEDSPRRCYYSRRFRRFVGELRGRYQDVEAADFARVVAVPQATLTDWLRPTRPS